jgi:hypothetical protein
MSERYNQHKAYLIEKYGWVETNYPISYSYDVAYWKWKFYVGLEPTHPYIQMLETISSCRKYGFDKSHPWYSIAKQILDDFWIPNRDVVSKHKPNTARCILDVNQIGIEGMFNTPNQTENAELQFYAKIFSQALKFLEISINQYERTKINEAHTDCNVDMDDEQEYFTDNSGEAPLNKKQRIYKFF